MSRRPSTISAASGSSLPSAARVSKSPSFSPPLSRRPSSASWVQRSASISSTLASQASLAPAELDPDDLFTKYSVAEVRNVQMRLRADADAKQEELRIMVGERYRDLLQASSSIIAIAESSVRVQDALEEMREAIPGPDFELHMPRRAGSGRKEDSHLKALQSLAAHMKLLLDTPEHLWRLIERKKYLHACWLFLLARVIHHALVRPNVEGDEEDWKTHGIDVEEQFPIVQRQWEAVGPFKSQIAYKATLSLREPSLSIEDICSVLLTLNLLDSEPLTKTLSTFLLQRTRSLQTSLTRPASASGQPSQVPNGSAPKTRKTIIREVRESLALVLQVIALTISAARRIFRHSPSSPSLMMRVLAFIDAPEPSPIIPVELQMSTQALLSNLPSTSHFALLPASIRMYKPYIDLDSPATTVASPHLVERIQQWFEQAVVELKRAASGWFAAVESLTDLWELRRWTRAWAENESQLEAAERDLLLETLDTVVRTHAAELWKARLVDMENEFNSELVAAVTALVDGTEEGLLEASPTTFLFQVPPQVSTFKFSGVSMAASFQNYSAALQRQITGRTPLLDRVLSAVENRSAALHEDLMSTTAGGQDDREVLTAYRPDADTFFTAVVTATSSTLERLTDESEATVRALAFLSRTVLELSSSPFLADVRHGTDAGAGFEEQARELHDMAVERWRQLTCESIIRDYVEAWDHISEASRSLNETSGVPSLPSSSLMQALLALASACHSANASMHLARSAATASMTLQVFIGSLLDSLEQRDILGAHRQPLLWDLRLLRKLASLWGNELVPITQGLDERIASMESKSGDDPPPDSDAAVAEHLARTHLLLAPLLPPSFAPVAASKSVRKDNVPNGLLFADTSPQPMMELVKPGPRFGMLLVESTAVE